ncbi:hypothetical protein RHECNPAF_1221006 [Rhizobium etli CNPAF512]|nr:hypothetical protein RHECNPAF_1221006 [Rhizobium etli CNPAF512]
MNVSVHPPIGSSHLIRCGQVMCTAQIWRLARALRIRTRTNDDHILQVPNK